MYEVYCYGMKLRFDDSFLDWIACVYNTVSMSSLPHYRNLWVVIIVLLYDSTIHVFPCSNAKFALLVRVIFANMFYLELLICISLNICSCVDNSRTSYGNSLAYVSVCVHADIYLECVHAYCIHKFLRLSPYIRCVTLRYVHRFRCISGARIQRHARRDRRQLQTNPSEYRGGATCEIRPAWFPWFGRGLRREDGSCIYRYSSLSMTGLSIAREVWLCVW